MILKFSPWHCHGPCDRHGSTRHNRLPLSFGGASGRRTTENSETIGYLSLGEASGRRATEKSVIRGKCGILRGIRFPLKIFLATCAKMLYNSCRTAMLPVREHRKKLSWRWNRVNIHHFRRLHWAPRPAAGIKAVVHAGNLIISAPFHQMSLLDIAAGSQHKTLIAINKAPPIVGTETLNLSQWSGWRPKTHSHCRDNC